MALDKFFCKVPETKVADKQIEFHSEREANEYCRDNDIDPHNVILMGDKYIIKTKDSGFRTTMDVRCNMSKSLDKAIRLCDAKVHDSVDIEHIADYLWTWVSGRDIAHELFDEGLDKYSGPHDPEHKKEAYEFARKYAASELNKVYSKLKSVVEKRLKEGFETNKRLIDSYK